MEYSVHVVFLILGSILVIRVLPLLFFLDHRLLGEEVVSIHHVIVLYHSRIWLQALEALLLALASAVELERLDGVP
jgi:hypothetical protein